MTESLHNRFFALLEARTTLINLREDTEIKLTEITPPLDWRALFGNKNPVEIEVGCGKGYFLLEVSRRHPEINYVGIERARKYLNRSRERLLKYMRSLSARQDSPPYPNVLLIWSDAPYFVDRYVADGSVRAYHIYFPDPWPKKRHHKRRLFNNEAWMRALIRTLDPNGGCLHIATDHTEYFDEIRRKLDQEASFTYIPPDATETEHIPTSFEKKYRAEGRQIYRAVYQMNKQTLKRDE